MNSTNCTDSTINTLNVALIKKMVDGYKENQLKFIKERMYRDAHSNWFDLETIKTFISHLEALVKEKSNNTISSADLGLRVYYARYPDKKDWRKTENQDLSDLLGNDITEQYENLHTLVIIPTIRRGQINFDFNPCDNRSYTSPLDSIPEFLYLDPNYQMHGIAFAKMENSGSAGAQNHGSLIPPGTDEGESF